MQSLTEKPYAVLFIRFIMQTFGDYILSSCLCGFSTLKTHTLSLSFSPYLHILLIHPTRESSRAYENISYPLHLKTFGHLGHHPQVFVYNQ